MLAVAGVSEAAPKKSSPKSKGTLSYRWVDENGVVHYGDSVPPQYATQETVVLNEQGIEVGRNSGQKSPEQLAKEAELAAAAARQRQHDQFLLNTYTSVRDIEQLRDQRLEQLQGQRVAAELYIEGLESRLSGLQARAMKFKPYSKNPNAHRMPDDLAEELVRTLNEVNSQRKALEAKAEEEAALRAQFQADIERFKELRSASARR
ncbi:MAG TPA: DUF4124 domain-containing protein [Steroidobacteraceae bacterium]